MKKLILTIAIVFYACTISITALAAETENPGSENALSNELSKSWISLKNWVYVADCNNVKYSDDLKKISFESKLKYEPNFTSEIKELVEGEISFKAEIELNEQGEFSVLFTQFKHEPTFNRYLYPFSYWLNSDKLEYKPVNLNRNDLESDIGLISYDLDKELFNDLKKTVTNYKGDFIANLQKILQE